MVNGLDRDKGEWNYTCSYYGFGKYSKLLEEETLFRSEERRVGKECG